MTEVVRVERGRYYDSVTLMRASAAAPGTVIAAMGTELNLGLLAEQGFEVPDATPDDLVIAVRADDPVAAIEAVEQVLAERPVVSTSVVPFHTVEAAVAGAPDAGVVVVSVPGRHAYVEAVAAVRAGRHVMVFSDGVDIAAEVALKQEAAEAGVLVMGPDCGTVILDGVGLGFANVVQPGPVGIVAASGTGAQQLCGLLDGAGIGVRHVLGVGGRDLSAAVGGMSTLAALAMLDDDPAVETIAIVSKPPDPEVAMRVAAACRKPVVLAMVGPGYPTLTEAAAEIAGPLAPESWEPASKPEPRSGPILGLYSGGTNCLEALGILESARSNVHPDPSRRIGPDDDPGGADVLLDLGDDELTVGRPHPMIDPSVVADRLAAVSGASVVILDVVLGHGAHPDPVMVLAPAIRKAVEAGIAVVVTLVGTAGDPQGLERQAEALVAAGASVYRSNAAAVGSMT